MLASIFHFEFHQINELLKDTYAPFDPDSDTRQYENTVPLINRNFVDLLSDLRQFSILPSLGHITQAFLKCTQGRS
jgi:hypothetical protein